MDFVQIRKFLMTFILKLYAEPSFPRKIVQIVLEFLDDFIRNIFLTSLKTDLLKILNNQ